MFSGTGEGSGTQHPPVNAGGPKMTGAMKLVQLGYLILFVNSTAKKNHFPSILLRYLLNDPETTSVMSPYFSR